MQPVSVLWGLEQMFTAATLGVQGALACSLSNTNIIESPQPAGDKLSECRQMSSGHCLNRVSCG
jgi:hypothetical protein